MARNPRPEENGQLVLNIFAHFRSQVGHVLRANNFVAVAARRHIPMSHIQDGLDYALKTHWVEQTESGALRLTQDGFRAMPEVGQL